MTVRRILAAMVVVGVVSIVAIDRSHSTAATEKPSGAAMPTTDPPGWKRVFSDDFSEPSIAADHRWKTYFGRPSGDPAGWWAPDHVVVTDGELQIQGYKDDRDIRYGQRPGTWVTGGISSHFAQTYGKYLVRFRMDQGRGIGGVLLLWPANNSWPPEIDFSEDSGAAPRDTTYASVHYGADDDIVTHRIGVDLARWHTLGVQWTLGRLVFTLDGHAWATVTGQTVPTIPMRLDIQTGENACGGSFDVCPDAHTPAHVDLDIDWVVIYAPTASATRQQALTRAANRASRRAR